MSDRILDLSKETMMEIGKQAFANGDWTEILLPETVKFLKEGAFKHNHNLTKVVLPNGLVRIESGVFYDCPSLTEINFPQGLSYIEHGAFNGCSQLTEIHLPQGLLYIGNGAFKDCSQLRKVVIPESVRDGGTDIFAGCTSLTDIWYGGSVHNCSWFYNNVNIPAESVHCSDGEAVRILNVPEGTTEIKPKQFIGLTTVEQVILPNSVRIIGDESFAECANLKKVVINEGVTHIGNGLGNNCDLDDIYYNGTMEQWAKIDNDYIIDGKETYSHIKVHCTDGEVEAKIRGPLFVLFDFRPPNPMHWTIYEDGKTLLYATVRGLLNRSIILHYADKIHGGDPIEVHGKSEKFKQMWEYCEQYGERQPNVHLEYGVDFK